MKNKTETFFTMLFIALVSALVTYCYLSPAREANIAQVQQTIQQEKKQEQAIEKSYAASLKKLQQQNDSLKKLSDQHISELNTAHQEVSHLEANVSHEAAQVSSEPDTDKSKISDCDSLGKATVILIEKEDEKDSLCTVTIDGLQAQVSDKDSIISDCNENYIQMRQAADSSIMQQEAMSNIMKELNKEVKRKTRQSRLMSAGLLILSGITATLFLTQSKL